MVDPTSIPDLLGYMPSGRWFAPLSTAHRLDVYVSANLLWAIPFFTPKNMAFDGIGIAVTTASAAGGKARLGIYSDDGNVYPGSLVVDAGEVAIDSTGNKTLSITETLKGLHWLVLLASKSSTLKGISVLYMIAILGTDSILTSPALFYRKLYTYGALPSTFPSAAVYTSANCPVIALKKA